MQVVETASFTRSAKKLHTNQIKDLDAAVEKIIANPAIGDIKVGDLTGMFVYKFRMVKQLTLLAYTFENRTITLTLIAFGSHENFYRDLKR